ncbi:hypothetical protein SNEBB_001851 [Seison nebaliae]|nr:hypothetical protein SNEBB_001851 [Seison nebaliae]
MSKINTPRKTPKWKGMISNEDVDEIYSSDRYNVSLRMLMEPVPSIIPEVPVVSFVELSNIHHMQQNVDYPRANVISRDDLSLKYQLASSRTGEKKKADLFRLMALDHRHCCKCVFIIQQPKTRQPQNECGDMFDRERPFSWKGILSRVQRDILDVPRFSVKIFLGGLPHTCTESMLRHAFAKYGTIRVESARTANLSTYRNPTRENNYPGYAYLIFENEHRIRQLLSDCRYGEMNHRGSYYLNVELPDMSSRNDNGSLKEVQIIAWDVSDSCFSVNQIPSKSCDVSTPYSLNKFSSSMLAERSISQYANDRYGFEAFHDTRLTIFVGALHGTITAKDLFQIMDNVFGEVSFVTIDVDKYKYPIGSARVTFKYFANYFAAVQSVILEVKTSTFIKRLRIDPYLLEKNCDICGQVEGLYFCRNVTCYRYFCWKCWIDVHNNGAAFDHSPIKRIARKKNFA